MILTNKTVDLISAAEMLSFSEDRVLKLSQHGFIAQATPRNGKTRLYVDSISKYARRNNITLSQPSPRSSRHFTSRTPEEAMRMLEVTEGQLHSLVQSGTLQAGFEGGAYLINGKSLYNYVMEGE